MRVIGRRVCHALRTYNYNPKATKAKPAYPQGCPGGSRGVKAAEAVRRPRSGSVCALDGRARGRAATQCASARRQRKGERSRTVSAQGNWMHSRQSQTVSEEEPDARTDRWLATWPQLGPERPWGAERVRGRASQRTLSQNGISLHTMTAIRHLHLDPFRHDRHDLAFFDPFHAMVTSSLFSGLSQAESSHDS